MEASDQIREQLLSIIHSTGATVMDHFPGDLDKDVEVLVTKGRPGTNFAWAFGNTSTELWPVGIHPALNNVILNVAASSRVDRYYRLTFGGEGKLAPSPLSRPNFLRLSQEPVAYRRKGLPEQFGLLCGARAVGEVRIRSLARKDPATPRLFAVITPARSCTDCDRTALEFWTDQAANEVAHSLWRRLEVEWASESTDQLAA